MKDRSDENYGNYENDENVPITPIRPISSIQKSENYSLIFHLFPKKMESKTARGAIFGVVACRQGGARFAHLKGVIDAFPLKSRLGSAEDTSPAEAGAWGWVRFINAFS